MIGYAQSLRQRMGNHYDGVFLLEPYKQFLNGLARYGVKGAGSLIGQNEIGLHSKAAGQAQTLLLTD